jgi:hypothetical protein
MKMTNKQLTHEEMLEIAEQREKENLLETNTVIEFSEEEHRFLGEDSGYDQSPINVEFSVEEHEYLMDILCNVADCYNFVLSSDDITRLPIDSETLRKYNIMRNLRSKFNHLWTQRFIDNRD